jgi:hypothetical protein
MRLEQHGQALIGVHSTDLSEVIDKQNPSGGILKVVGLVTGDGVELFLKQGIRDVTFPDKKAKLQIRGDALIGTWEQVWGGPETGKEPNKYLGIIELRKM